MKKYPEEMKQFIIENMEEHSNRELCGMINSKFDFEQEIKYCRLKSYMKNNNLRRKTKKRLRSNSKYNKEVLQFLKENIDNMSNIELTEEIEKRFKFKVLPGALNQTMKNRGIERIDKIDEEDIPKEIIDFILKSEEDQVIYLRDEIIIKFEKDISMGKIKKIMSKRKKDITEEKEENDVDDMDDLLEDFEEDEKMRDNLPERRR